VSFPSSELEANKEIGRILQAGKRGNSNKRGGCLLADNSLDFVETTHEPIHYNKNL
jgi:hypothetical protein